jgi:tRNA-specific 2-thiouridylase
MGVRVGVGLSGGIDSTFSAYILQKQGYEVVGIYLKMFKNDEYHKRNIDNIKKIAKFLNIEYFVFDITKKFNDIVLQPFIDSYVNGFTPNPCGVCNQFIKFKELIDIATNLKCQFTATGHYIKSDRDFIYEADDEKKDQSYFLFHIDPNVLKKVIFPLSNRKKEDIKEFLKTIPFLEDIASQKESHDICFIDTDYKDFLKRYINIEQEGDILDKDGKIIGKHKGYINYTIGQRRGIETTLKKRIYVNKIDPISNTITVGDKIELQKTTVFLKDVNLFFQPQTDTFYTTVKLRYKTKKLKCKVVLNGNSAVIYLKDLPELGIAKGQAAVFYDDNKMIGGGWIVDSK